MAGGLASRLARLKTPNTTPTTPAASAIVIVVAHPLAPRTRGVVVAATYLDPTHSACQEQRGVMPLAD